MKGSPMQRNFGIGGSPVRQTEEVVEETTEPKEEKLLPTEEAAMTAWNAKWGDQLKIELAKQAKGDKSADLEFISAARSALQEIAGD
jgi:uncharacterized protein (DUF111 family)